MYRSLIHFWRMNLAVIGGVAVTTAVLTGALMVGDSLRGSLRDLTMDRLGRTDQALLNNRFFPADLASRLARQPELQATAADLVPAILLKGSALHSSSERRASGVQVLGIDGSFASLFPASQRPGDLVVDRAPNQIFPSVVLNETLRQELNASVGDEILISFGRPSAVPTASLMGRREQRDILTTLRLTVAGVIPATGPGRFGLESRQTRPLNAFVDLSTLQRRLDKRLQINLVLVGRPAAKLDDDKADGYLEEALSNHLSLEDLGLRLHPGVRLRCRRERGVASPTERRRDDSPTDRREWSDSLALSDLPGQCNDGGRSAVAVLDRDGAGGTDSRRPRSLRGQRWCPDR